MLKAAAAVFIQIMREGRVIGDDESFIEDTFTLSMRRLWRTHESSHYAQNQPSS